MSFIDQYLSKERFSDLTSGVKEKLDKIESALMDTAKEAGASSFEDCLKGQAVAINGLVERVSAKVKDVQVKSLKDALGLLRFVKNIGFEVYQLVDQLADCSIPKNLAAEEAKKAKVQLGVDLTHFVWITVSPLKDKFKWIPFKQSLESKLVKWLAGMSIQFAFDFFEKAKESVKKSSTKSLIKVL
jgi:hypothetical protein